MKCTTEKCDKEADYIVNGQSVCKEHKENKEPEQEQTGQSAADKMIYG